MKKMYKKKAVSAVMGLALMVSGIVSVSAAGALVSAKTVYAETISGSGYSFDTETKELTLSGEINAKTLDQFRGSAEVITAEEGSSLPVSCAALFAGFGSCTRIDISKTDKSGVMVTPAMFAGCIKLTSLELGKFDTSKVVNMSQMFNGCTALETVDVSGFDTSNVTDMSKMFSGCAKLETLDVSKFNTAKVTDMSDMFNGCRSLKELDVSKFNTAKVTNMSNMFNGCSYIETLDIKNFTSENLQKVGSMFNGCSSLKSLDLSSFDTSKLTDFSYMFAGCSSLKELNINSFDVGSATNLNYMFSNCASLLSLDLSKFDLSGTKTVQGLFNKCEALDTLVLGEKISGITEDMMLPNEGKIWVIAENTSESIGGSGQYAVFENSGLNTYYRLSKQNGDMDGNFIIDQLDAVLYLKHISGSSSFTASQLARADVNRDGRKDIRDVVEILNIIDKESAK